jgi:hypothetical protein
VDVSILYLAQLGTCFLAGWALENHDGMVISIYLILKVV